jgi:hypothetical protein
MYPWDFLSMSIASLCTSGTLTSRDRDICRMVEEEAFDMNAIFWRRMKENWGTGSRVCLRVGGGDVLAHKSYSHYKINS